MATRYSSSIRAGGVVPRYLFGIQSVIPIWVLGFSFYYVGSSHIATRTMGRYLFNRPCLLTHLEVVCRCRDASNYNFTGIKHGFPIVHEYEDDKRTIFCLADKMAAGSILNRKKRRAGDSKGGR